MINYFRVIDHLYCILMDTHPKAQAFYDSLTQYLRVNEELLYLKAIQRLSLLVSSFVSYLIIGIISLMALLLFNIALCYYLVLIFNSTVIAFSLLAGVYLILFIILSLIRKSVLNPYFKKKTLEKFMSNLH